MKPLSSVSACSSGYESLHRAYDKLYGFGDCSECGRSVGAPKRKSHAGWPKRKYQWASSDNSRVYRVTASIDRPLCSCAARKLLCAATYPLMYDNTGSVTNKDFQT